MEGEDGVPLLVGSLVNDTVPCETCVVHDDVDLSASKLGGLLDEVVDVVVVEDISWN